MVDSGMQNPFKVTLPSNIDDIDLDEGVAIIPRPMDVYTVSYFDCSTSLDLELTIERSPTGNELCALSSSHDRMHVYPSQEVLCHRRTQIRGCHRVSREALVHNTEALSQKLITHVFCNLGRMQHLRQNRTACLSFTATRPPFEAICRAKRNGCEMGLISRRPSYSDQDPLSAVSARVSCFIPSSHLISWSYIDRSLLSLFTMRRWRRTRASRKTDR